MFNKKNRDKRRHKTPKTSLTSKASRPGRRGRDRKLKDLVTDEPDTILLDNNAIVTVRGATALSGAKVVNVSDGNVSAYAPLSSFTGSGGEGVERLKSGGLLVMGSTKDLCAAIGAIDCFPSRPLVERVGWTGNVFAEPGGRVFAPTGVDRATALFPPYTGVTNSAGNLNDWLNGVATPLSDHAIAAFFLMTAYAAPILPLTDIAGNPGFELAGDAGTGKTSLMHLVASVAGPSVNGSDGRYWLTCLATANGFETVTRRHRHMPMILEEASLFYAGVSAPARAAAMLELVFRLSSGSSKQRHGDNEQETSEFVFTMTTNIGIATLLGDHRPEVTVAACDRLMTVPIDRAEWFGVFRKIPKPYHSGSHFMTTLLACARQNYGVAMPVFLQALVDARQADEITLRRYIRQRMASFRRLAGVDPNDGSSVRVANAFGLVYAAGCLARDYGALPAGFRCRSAAVRCYQLHRTDGRPLPDPVQRLAAWSQRADVIDLDTTEFASLTAKQIADAGGYWRTNRDKDREFLMTRQQFRQAFPDFENRYRFDGLMRYLRKDKGRNKTKRVIDPSEPKIWVYCFVLPERGWF